MKSETETIEPFLQAGGILIGWDKHDKDKFYCVTEDTHALIIGMTRCGKTRCNVLETIVILGMAGETIIAVDPKAELHGYTREFLLRMGYEIICIDFKDPQRSNRYNFLQPVIDAGLLGNIPLAVQRAREVVSILAPKNNRSVDTVWVNGERSVLMMGILAVCLECKDPEHQNLANAREFIAKMCKPTGPKDELPLEAYVKDLSEDSALVRALDIAQIAPEKMRGSFYTSALTTLDLFTDPHVHAMTSETDFDYFTSGDRRRAIFIILPDAKEAYYPLASLFVCEQYQALSDAADERGGRLKVRVNFVCDEFGNFVEMPNFKQLITVGGGKGIRLMLYVQDLGQITALYGDELGKTISSNCETWIYLKTENNDTLEDLVKKIGQYTIKSPNVSSSTTGGSSGYSFTGRDLLGVSEFRRIRRPYQVVFSGYDPAVMYAPDISKTPFNKLLGMGGQAHNLKLVKSRNDSRETRSSDISFWNVWEKYIKQLESNGGKTT